VKFGEQEVSVKCWKTETTVEIYLCILDSRLMRKNETEVGKTSYGATALENVGRQVRCSPVTTLCRIQCVVAEVRVRPSAVQFTGC